MWPMLIPAIISAMAAAGGGIAGAAGQQAQADFNAQQSAQDRALQERVLKMQLAQQQGIQNQDLGAQATQNLGNAYANQAQNTQRAARAQIGAGDDFNTLLAKAFLS